MTTIDARKLTPEAQEALRMRAIEHYLQHANKSETARVFGVSRQAVTGWVESYEEKGMDALRKQKRGRRPGHKKLKGWQAAQVVWALTDKCPDQLKLPFVLWTRGSVRDFIKRRFGVRLGLTAVGRYLKRWGFTPQKPLKRAWEQNPEEVERWLTEEYPRIRARAAREKAEISWGDEMGLRSDHTAGTSYGKRGKTPVIPGTGKRFGCSMISAITNHGTLRFMVFTDRFRAKVFIDFLRRLIHAAGRKVYLIVDRHPVHTSKQVSRWLDEHRDRIHVYYLPGYSPELNPDECLNQDVKANALGRQRPSSRSEMIGSLRSYLHATQKRPDTVRNYFQAETVRYAAL
jgi:transposase